MRPPPPSPKTSVDPALHRTLVWVMLLALALVLHGLEALLPPPLPVPGVKLGLANLMTVLAMLALGVRAGVMLALARSVLGSLLLGTFLSVGFFLSLGGVIASALVTAVALCWLRPALSLVGVSVLGALAHNTVQLGLAWLWFVHSGVLFFYLPVLWLLAAISGTATGLVLRALEDRGVLTSLRAGAMLNPP